jgi:hypothetical protein
MARSDNAVEPGFDIGYEGHLRRQARLGLEMTPAERLHWLEMKLAEMRGLLGKARPAPAAANAVREDERAKDSDNEGTASSTTRRRAPIH